MFRLRCSDQGHLEKGMLAGDASFACCCRFYGPGDGLEAKQNLPIKQPPNFRPNAQADARETRTTIPYRAAELAAQSAFLTSNV